VTSLQQQAQSKLLARLNSELELSTRSLLRPDVQVEPTGEFADRHGAQERTWHASVANVDRYLSLAVTPGRGDDFKIDALIIKEGAQQAHTRFDTLVVGADSLNSKRIQSYLQSAVLEAFDVTESAVQATLETARERNKVTS
jgi:hypothetical protein